MKQYRKTIDGKTVIKTRNQIVIKKNGMNTFNPTEAMLLADGWEEYIIPEPTEAELLERAKRAKKREIEAYDTSANVNEFGIGEQGVWLDKATRAGLLLRFQAEQARGIISTTLWYNGAQFPLQVDQAIQMLYAIELYASECYDNTQRHLAEVDNLTIIAEVENYDYQQGYPDKLQF